MAKFQEIINSNIPTLVDFHAEWCGPCQGMKPILDQLKEKRGDKIRVLKVDVDKNAQASTAYKIMGVPTFILFQNGEMKWKKPGAFTLHQLEQMIDEVIPL